MNTEHAVNDSTDLVDDLAAQWTEATLHILKASGIEGASVPMEIETWHTLKEVLHAGLRWYNRFRAPPVTLDEFMEQILLKATLRMARKVQPQADGGVLEQRIRPLIQRPGLKSSVYRQIVRRRVANGQARPGSRTDYFPRMSTGGGYSRRVS